MIKFCGFDRTGDVVRAFLIASDNNSITKSTNLRRW